MNYPAASCAVSQERDGKYPKGVTPECFYRGPVPDPPGFPLKTCGNDGLRKAINLTQQAAGTMTRSDSTRNRVDATRMNRFRFSTVAQND